MTMHGVRQWAGIMVFIWLLCGPVLADDPHAPAAATPAGEAAPAAEPHHGAGESHSAGGDHGAAGHAAGHHGDGRDFDFPPLYFSLQLFLFSGALFIGYFLYMKNSTWQELITALNEREARVQQAEHDAAQAKAEAARFHEQAEQRMVEAHAQVKDILAKARAEAESNKQRIVAEAEREATRAKDEALAEIAAARQDAIAELSSMVDSQAVLASSRIAGRSLN